MLGLCTNLIRCTKHFLKFNLGDAVPPPDDLFAEAFVYLYKYLICFFFTILNMKNLLEFLVTFPKKKVDASKSILLKAQLCRF